MQLVEAEEKRPLRPLIEDVKRVKGGVWVEHEQRSKQGEKENKTERKEEKETMVRKLEEKENRVGGKEEQVVNSWRRSVAVAPRK